MSWVSDYLDYGIVPPAVTQLVSAGPPALGLPPGYSATSPGLIAPTGQQQIHAFNGGMASMGGIPPSTGSLANASGTYVPGVNSPVPYQVRPGSSGCDAQGQGCSWLNIVPCWDRIYCQINAEILFLWESFIAEAKKVLILTGENLLGLIVVLLGIYLVFRPQVNAAVKTGAKVALL